ncbi:hypothetical protein [Haloplanus halophilus]|uniref:hypothetical protein n=1 Tax=Haloplanus halophilus TaxID=2949993 RepID=UPI002040D61A|nr:hypothetical protein [Haloplanus sp. GDY1]
MVPSSRQRVLLAALVVGAVFAPLATGAATASPRPVPVCSPCERGFVSAAQTHDHPVRIERSTATMRVHRNGSATWTVENRLNDSAAAAFRENATLRRSVAEDAVSIHDARLLSTGVDGDTVRLRYRTPTVATDAPGGVLRVGYFRDDPGAMVRAGLGADRLTLVAPEGMVVERGLPGADVSDRRMTVTSFEGSGDGPFVTLAPEGSLLAPLWSLVAVAAALAGVVGRNLLLLVALPSAVFAGGLALVAWTVGRTDLGSTTTPDRRALAVLGLGALALAHPLYAGAVVAGSTPPLLAVGVGAVALGGALALPTVRDRLSPSRLAAVVVGAFALAVVAALLLRALPLGDLSIRDDANVLTLVLPALPLYAVTLVGYAAAHTSLRRALAAAVAALALVLATTFSIASQGGTLYFLGVVLAVLGAVAGVVLGVPFFLLGYGLPGPDGRGDRRNAGATA